MKVKIDDPILRPLTDEQMNSLGRRDLIALLRGEQQIRQQLVKIVTRLEDKVEEERVRADEAEEKVLEIEGVLCRIRTRIFTPSSEKSQTGDNSQKKRRGKKKKAKTTRLPSDRYPNAEIIEKDITLETLPTCGCCGKQMSDSGMVETSEHLTTVPKKIVVVRELRHKYRCESCHGGITTTPPLPRVVPGGSYSDEMIADASLSKYCDLIPMERYSQMAHRQGFEGLPPQSLIAASFKLADFLRAVYLLIKQEVLASAVILADETPHRMLEGDAKRAWSLWGFNNETACFFECHDTRSGDVASSVLMMSQCRVLLTDVFSGYRKAIRETNEAWEKAGKPDRIKAAYCNGHARRQFDPKAPHKPREAEYMLDRYDEIYRLNSLSKGQQDEEVLRLRALMVPIFTDMKTYSEKMIEAFSSKSSLGGAFGYFLNNFDGLTLFLTDPRVPIDNNGSERLLRSHVVGRKTWYGTHSRDGAKVASIHFSIVESCKLAGVNPRMYYREMIRRLHAKETVVTPNVYKAAPTGTS